MEPRPLRTRRPRKHNRRIVRLPRPKDQIRMLVQRDAVRTRQPPRPRVVRETRVHGDDGSFADSRHFADGLVGVVVEGLEDGDAEGVAWVRRTEVSGDPGTRREEKGTDLAVR